MTGTNNISDSKQTLTDNQYWEEYWKDESNSVHTSVGELSTVFSKLDWSKYKSIIEIGGFPGSNVAYISKHYGPKPYILDFVSNEEVLNRVTTAFGLKENIEVLHTDFLKSEPAQTWDSVLSVGFIEHFANPMEVMDRHFEYCSDQGVVIITVPNIKNSFYGLVTFLFNREAFKTHNTTCMSPGYFKKYAESRDIQSFETGYWGISGNYWLPSEKENFLSKWPLLVVKKLIRTFFSKIKGQFISPAIYFIAYKQ